MKIRSWCKVIAELSAARRGTGNGQVDRTGCRRRNRLGAGCSCSASFQLELDQSNPGRAHVFDGAGVAPEIPAAKMRVSGCPGKGHPLYLACTWLAPGLHLAYTWLALGPPSAPHSPHIRKRRRRRDLATNGGTVLLEKARRAPAFGGLAGSFSAHEEVSTGLKNHVITRRNPPTRC
jgi:hypothetical protein